jgi:hypothetical protein
MVDFERNMHSGSWPHGPIVARRRSSRAGVGLPTAREFYSGLAVLTVCGAIAMMRGGPEQSRAASSQSMHQESSSSLHDSGDQWHGRRSTARDAHGAHEKTRSE